MAASGRTPRTDEPRYGARRHPSLRCAGRPRPRGPWRTAVAAVALGAAAFAGCSSATGTATGSGTSPTPAIPLSSSTVAGATTWATLVMGRGDDTGTPAESLLALADGSPWQVVTPPGVVGHGDLVATATALPASVLVGAVPSRKASRSPVARRTGPGSAWEQGGLPSALAPVPDALVQGAVESLALLRSGGGAVVVTTGDLSRWTPVTSDRSLNRRPALSGCRIRALTALTITADGSPLVGASCAAGGQAGLFAPTSTGWVSAGPGIPGVTGGPTEVLRLDLTAAGTTALVSAGSGIGVRLYAMWSTNALRTWTVSAGLSLDGAALVATGVTGPGGFVVTTRASGYAPTASVVTPTGVQWHSLPALPSGTTSVTGTPSGGFDALVPAPSALSVYGLAGQHWDEVQRPAVDGLVAPPA